MITRLLYKSVIWSAKNLEVPCCEAFCDVLFWKNIAQFRDVCYHPQLTTCCEFSPIRKITKKLKNLKKKFLDKAKQGLYIGVFKGTDLPLFCVYATLLLCYGLIFVRGKLKWANSSGLNFWKYTPLARLLARLTIWQGPVRPNFYRLTCCV